MTNEHFTIIFVLALSITIQFTAAIVAFRLIAITGRRSAWSLIALALTLMAVRRVVPLYRLLTGDLTLPPDLLNEEIGLVLSILMAAGIARIAPLFIERKQVETAIRESEAKYRIVADNTYDWEFWINPEGQFIYLSPSCKRITGYDPDEFITNPGLLLEIIHPEDRLSFESHRHDAEKGKLREDFKFRVITSNGDVRWLGHVCQPVFDSKGQFIGTRGNNRDVTRQKLAEDALKEQYSTLQGIIESMDALVFSVDREYRYTSFNNAHASVMQAIYGAEIQTGHSLLDHMTVTEDRETAKKNLDRALAGERLVESAYSGEEMRSRLYFEVSHNPILTEDGAVIGVAVLSRNVTEQKRAEEELLERERHSQSLLRLSRNLERAQGYAEILNAARDEVRNIIGYQSLWAYLLTDDKKYFKSFVAGGPMSDTVMSEDGTATLAIEGDKMLEEIAEAKGIVVVEDAQTDERVNKEIVAHLGNRTLVNVPIILFDQHLGSVGMGTFGDEGVLVPTESELKYLTALASHMAVTFDRIHLLAERKRAEKALKESEEKYRVLLETSTDIILTHDLDGRISYINQAGVAITEYSETELIGTIISAILPPDELVAMKKRQKARLHGETETYQYETKFVSKSGKYVPVEVHSTPIIKDGRNREFLINARDITERKRVEEALKSSEEKYRTLIQKIQAAVIVHGADTQILTSNQMAQELLGLTEDQLLGRTAIDPAWHFFLEDGTVTPIEKYPVNQVLASRKSLRNFVLGTHRPNKEKDVWVLVNADPVFGREDEIIQVIVTFIDITERKQVEKALRAASSYNRRLIEASLDPLVTIGPDGKITDVNDATEKATGVDRKQLIGSDFSDYFAEPEKARNGYQQVLSEGFVKDYPLTMQHASGKAIDVLYNAAVYENAEGQVEGVFAAARDITERKKAEFVLRQSEEALKEAQRLAHVGSWYMDLATNEVYWSEVLYQIYGFDPALPPPLYTESMKLFTPESWERLSAAIAQVTETGIPYELELETIQKDGGRGWMLARGELVRDAHGAAVRVRGVVMDITERKQAEAAMRRLNRELRAISNCNQTLMRAVDETTLLSEICRIVCDEAGYRMSWVGYAENDAAKTVRPAAWAGVEDGYLTTANITWADTERGRGPTGVSIRSGESTIIQDFATDPHAAPWREDALRRNYRSSIALPLKDEDANTFGVLCIYATEPNAFTPDEMRLLEELAGDLAFGIVVLRARIERKRTEERLRYLASIVQSSDDAITGKTLDGIVTSWNNGAEKIYGYTEDEMIGRPISMLIPPDRADEVRLILERIKGGEHIEHYETIRRRKDGQQIDMSLTISPVHDREGKIIGASTIGRDITERKRAEEVVRESEAQLNEAQRIAHIGSWQLDIINNILSWSDEIYRMFEIDPEKFGASYDAFLDAIHPDDREAVNFAYTDSLNTHTPYTIEHRLLFKDGRIKYVHEQCETIYDADGKPIRSFGTVQDITERKQAEAEIQALAKFPNENPNPVLRVTKDGVLLYANRASDYLMQFWGCSVGERLPEPWRTLVPQVLNSGLLKEEEMVCGARIVVLTFTPIIENGYVNLYGRDITKRKQAEEALRRSESFSRSIIENEPECVKIVGAGGILKYMNPAGLAMIEVEDLAVVVGQSVFPIVVPEHREAFIDLTEKVLRGERGNLQFEIIGMKGTRRWLDTHAVPLFDDQGNVESLLGLTRDVTERKQAEEKLRVSEEKFRAIIEQSSEGIALVDETGMIVEWNQTNENMTGLESSRIIGMPLWDMMLLVAAPERNTAQHHEAFKATVLEALRTGQSYLFAKPVEAEFYPQSSNEKHYLHQTIFPIKTEKGYRIASLTHDITERKRAEKALRESEERYRMLFNVMDEGVAINEVIHDEKGDVVDYVVLEVNPAFTKNSTFTREQVLGKQATSLYHMTPEFIRDWWQKHSEMQHVVHTEMHYAPTNRWFYITTTPPEGDRFATFSVDITERKQAEEEIARSLEAEKKAHETAEILREASDSLARTMDLDDILQNLLDYLSRLVPYDSANVMLLEGDFELCVSAVRGYERWTEVDMTQKLVFDVRTAPVLNEVVTTKKSLLIANTYERSDWIRPSGAEHVVNWLGIPIISDRQVIGLYSIDSVTPGFFTEEHRHLAEGLAGQAAVAIQNARLHNQIKRANVELEQRVLVRTSQLEAANKELEAFAYSVSHDLRAPLRHIDGFIDMLQNKTKATLDDQSRHYMDVIADSANKMGTLIDDLLSFSRMGRNEMFRSQVNLDELVQDVIQDFKLETEGRKIQWEISPLPLVTGDRAMLRIVLVNLISNALKFTRPRETARIEIGCEKPNDAEVVIHVRDNGVGFDMNYADKLFGVFQRLHRQEDFEGTGIGLANVHRVISRHGGRVWADGQVDQGATFYFSLPVL